MRFSVTTAVALGATLVCASSFEPTSKTVTARNLKFLEARNIPGPGRPAPPTVPERPVTNTPSVPGRPGGPGSIPPISPPSAPIPEIYKPFTNKPAPNGGRTRRQLEEVLQLRDVLEARVIPAKPTGPASQPPVQPGTRPSSPAPETVEPSVNRPPYSINGRELAEALAVRDLLDEIYSSE
ncbi:hypothetical protein EIP91_004017 [Steccherinum ochraceum]|uniref:Uncharacterized protein n=1 Tax=Steccherinum ochraceum TaxID=92696 RepID=A0A4R0R9L3_9APHY|nr:hypothetical protein EIP91_004017 [Steccherinum ochraceum]